MKLVDRDYLKQFSEFDNHQLVAQLFDERAGLKGFIAIHNTHLGPAVGGTRLYAYDTEEQALADVLRLSRAMTYKCAAAGVAFGGGKGVIIGEPTPEKRAALLQAYAQAVAELGGQFFTGEDVGITEADVQFMLRHSSYFIGKAEHAGDPSPYAALSTYYAMQAAIKEKTGATSLFGVKVVVKGLGKVGSELARLLLQDGAVVTGADIKLEAAEAVKKALPGLTLCNPHEAHRLSAHVFAPCALGQELTNETVPEIKARVVCGSANNQLASDGIGDDLFKRGILYVPDYVANAGGLIDVVDELREGGFNKERVKAGVEAVRTTVTNILRTALQTNVSPHSVANQLAEKMFQA